MTKAAWVPDSAAAAILSPKVKHKLFTFGRYRLLVTEPHSWAFGHIALEMATSMKIARRERAMLYFVRAPQVVNHALFMLEGERVRVVPRGHWVGLPITVLWRIWKLRAGVSQVWQQRRIELADRWIKMKRRRLRAFQNWSKAQLKRGLVTPDLSKELRAARKEQLKRLEHRLERMFNALSKGPRPSAVRYIPYYQRRLLREPLPVRLLPDAERAARMLALHFGIPDSARIVTLHVRESGFKLSAGRPEREEEAIRNARIETYTAAMDYLVAEGFTVVRMGDPTMTPVTRPGVVDLATAPINTDLLQLYCLMRSEFLVASESGPFAVCFLTNTPHVLVNATNPISSYPIRREGLYILKRPIDIESGRAT